MKIDTCHECKYFICPTEYRFYGHCSMNRHYFLPNYMSCERFESKDNPPLTWDELTQMEGKPVWVETNNEKFWTVVDSIKTICNQECLCCSKGYMCRSTHARGDWQAYRKERK